jgi:hypothetical protein
MCVFISTPYIHRAGVATAFAAPIGGLLFTVEEGVSFYSTSIFWRGFLSTGIGVFTLHFLVECAVGPPGLPWPFSHHRRSQILHAFCTILNPEPSPSLRRAPDAVLCASRLRAATPAEHPERALRPLPRLWALYGQPGVLRLAHVLLRVGRAGVLPHGRSGRAYGRIVGARQHQDHGLPASLHPSEVRPLCF